MRAQRSDGRKYLITGKYLKQVSADITPSTPHLSAYRNPRNRGISAAWQAFIGSFSAVAVSHWPAPAFVLAWPIFSGCSCSPGPSSLVTLPPLPPFHDIALFGHKASIFHQRRLIHRSAIEPEHLGTWPVCSYCSLHISAPISALPQISGHHGCELL